MLIEKDNSLLLVVDMQDKLLPHVKHTEAVLRRAKWLLGVANAFQVPVMLSEQYPKGLGPTVAELKSLMDTIAPYEKNYFSCTCQDKFMQDLADMSRQQVIIMGIEAHVCVLQTALALREKSYEVFVVSDCISSRNTFDYDISIKRLTHSGVHIVSSEMCLFEWARCADSQFKDIQRSFLMDKDNHV